jgi:hypothetical protein
VVYRFTYLQMVHRSKVAFHVPFLAAKRFLAYRLLIS